MAFFNLFQHKNVETKDSIMNKKFIRILLFIIGILLVLDTTILITLKKFNFGIIIPLLIGIVFIIQAIYGQKISHYLARKPKLRKLWQIGWLSFGIWSITLFSFFAYIHQNTQDDQDISNMEIIIVLGAGIENNQPSPVLTERLDKAAEIFAKNSQALIIVTGGLGFTRTISEAEVMSNYLQEKYRIPSLQIALEKTSTNTALNLKNSLPIIESYGLNHQSATVIVTNDFHTLRSEAIARKLGFKNVTSAGAPMPLYIRYNAWFREYFSYISGWLFNEF